MKNTLRSLVAVAALAAAPALAADVIVDVPAPPVVEVAPTFTWTGAYVGAQLGFLDATDDGNTVLGRDTDIDGFIGGVHAGYNFDFGGFVAGVYADVDFSSADVDLEPITGGPGFNGIGDLNYVARGMVKAGYSAGRVFGYAQGGIAFASVDLDTVVGGERFTSDLDSYGYVVGAGVDVAVTDNFVVGADYLFHNFNDFDNVTGVGGTVASTGNLDLDAHTFRAKFAYKF